MKRTTQRHQVNVALGAELFARLQALAARERRTLAQLARIAIENFLADKPQPKEAA
jgi:predicted DNA-binding protein